MKLIKLSFVLIFTVLIFSCKDDENGTDCSLIDCIGGDYIEFEFLKSGKNVLELDSLTEITITQASESILYPITAKTVRVFVSAYTPLTVEINDILIQIDIESTNIEGGCCGGLEIDQLSIGDNILCEDESCNSIIQVELN